MSICKICEKEITPATPTVESVGGFFDPEDTNFFVIDQENVMPPIATHRDCFLEKLLAKGN